jgi:hypothetical protein
MTPIEGVLTPGPTAQSRQISPTVDMLYKALINYKTTREERFLCTIGELAKELRERGFTPIYDPQHDILIVARKPVDLAGFVSPEVAHA